MFPLSTYLVSGFSFFFFLYLYNLLYYMITFYIRVHQIFSQILNLQILKKFGDLFIVVYCKQYSILTCEKQSGFVISRIVKTSDVPVILFVILMFHSYANTYGWLLAF